MIEGHERWESKYRIKRKVPLTEEQRTALGEITANFSRLDTHLDMCVERFMSANIRPLLMRIITSELSFNRKLSILSSLYIYKEKDKKKQAEFKSLRARASQAEEKRNIFTHSTWLSSKQEDTAIRVKITAKMKKGLQIKSEATTADNLRAIAEFINEVANDMFYFFFR